jgi:hypothetical protein
MVMEDDDGTFPFGSQQFINLTGMAVEVKSEGRRLTLKGNTRGIITNQGADYGYSLREILVEGSDGQAPGYSLRTLRNPEIRTLTFLLPDPDNARSVRSRSIEDARPAAEPTKR